MTRYVLTPAADQDLRDIWEYIARDSHEAANRVDEQLHGAMHRLAEHPNIGHVRADISDPRYRFWKVYSYLVVYRPDTTPVQVIRVVSGYRDLAKLFE